MDGAAARIWSSLSGLVAAHHAGVAGKAGRQGRGRVHDGFLRSLSEVRRAGAARRRHAHPVRVQASACAGWRAVRGLRLRSVRWGARRCGAASAPRAAVAAGFALGAAVEVVDLLGRERHAVDGLAVLLVVVVAQPADDVDVRALAQVLGGVLGLLAPQRPLDRGGLLLALLARTAPGVADGGQHGLGDLAFAAVDEFELDGAGQVRVTLDDLNVGHGDLLVESDQPGPGPGSLKTDPLARTSSLPPTGGRGVGMAPSLTGRGWGWVVFFSSRSSEPVSRPTA